MESARLLLKNKLLIPTVITEKRLNKVVDKVGKESTVVTYKDVTTNVKWSGVKVTMNDVLGDGTTKTQYHFYPESEIENALKNPPTVTASDGKVVLAKGIIERATDEEILKDLENNLKLYDEFLEAEKAKETEKTNNGAKK